MRLKYEYLQKLKETPDEFKQKLALKMMVNKRTIYNWIANNNIKLCDERSLSLLAREFNVSMNYLLTLNEVEAE